MRALHRATGEPRWETPIAKGEMHFIGEALHLDGPRLYVVHTHAVMNDINGIGLVRIDPTTGAVRRRVGFSGTRLFEETITADGRLPRFAPVTIFATRFQGLGANDVTAEDFRHGRLWMTGCGTRAPTR